VFDPKVEFVLKDAIKARKFPMANMITHHPILPGDEFVISSWGALPRVGIDFTGISHKPEWNHPNKL
jgi:hypothetical protein